MSKISLPVSIAVAGFLVASTMLVTTFDIKDIFSGLFGKDKQAIEMPLVQKSKDHILGNPDAPLFIIEYSDTECPFCRDFHNTVKNILEDWGPTGNVSLVYRHMATLNSNSYNEALASECVAEISGNQDFWKYIASIYNQKFGMQIDPQEPRANIYLLATDLGIPEEEMIDCVESDRFKEKVDRQLIEAISEGAKGTPFIVLEYRKGFSEQVDDVVKNIQKQANVAMYFSSDNKKIVIDGALSYEQLSLLIDSIFTLPIPENI